MKLQIVKVLPQLNPNAIERAVDAFLEDSRVEHVDKIGMFNQTIETIAQSILIILAFLIPS